MLDLAFPLIIGGLYALFITLRPARNEEDVMESELRDADRKKEVGEFIAGHANKYEWAYRTTYRHPVLMRLPGALMLTAAVIIILLENIK